MRMFVGDFGFPSRVSNCAAAARYVIETSPNRRERAMAAGQIEALGTLVCAFDFPGLPDLTEFADAAGVPVESLEAKPDWIRVWIAESGRLPRKEFRPNLPPLFPRTGQRAAEAAGVQGDRRSSRSDAPAPLTPAAGAADLDASAGAGESR